MSIKKRLLKGGLAMLVLRVFSIVLMLVINGCLTRWMTPEEVASYVAGMNLLILISLIGTAGLNQSMIRLIAGRKQALESPKHLIWRCWLAAFLFSVVITGIFAVLLRTVLGAWLDIDAKLIVSLLVCSLLISAHRLLEVSLRSIHAIASSSFLAGRSGGPLANSAFFPLAAILAFGGLTAVKTLWAFAGGLLLTLPIGWWMLHKAIKAAEDELVRRRSAAANSMVNETADAEETDQAALGAEAKNVLLFSLPFLMVQVLVYFATEFDVLIAKAYASPEDTALFGTSRRLILQVLAPVQILTASVGSTIAELYARNQREDLQKMLRYSATLACAITFPLLLVCIAAPQFILSAIFGDFYAAGATVFIIMAIGQLANTLTGQCGSLMMLSGHTTVMLVVRTVAAICMIFLGSLFTIRYGTIGLAVTTASILALQNIVVWMLAYRYLGLWTHPTLRLKKPKVKLAPKPQ